MTQIQTTTQAPLRTLGLKLSKRTLGYAVLKGNDLQLFGVHGFYGRSRRVRTREAAEFVMRLLAGFSPDVLAIDRPDKDADDPAAPIRKRLLRLARTRELRVRPFTFDAMTRVLSKEPDATRGDITATVVEWFPYLERYLRTDIRTAKVYWRKMLEAVALACAARQEIEKRRVLRALRHTVQEPSAP